LGEEVDRVDGVQKATGTARYAYDAVYDKMLLAKGLGSPHAHARISTLDWSEASQVPGVVDVFPMKKVGDELNFQGELIACVAAETEGAAAEGVSRIKATYEQLPVFVNDADLEAAANAERTQAGGKRAAFEKEPPDGTDVDQFQDAEVERLLKESHVVLEASYGVTAITHMCLEPHGSTCEWKDGKLWVDLSTQNVSGTAGQFAQPLEITADDVTVHCDFIGGGFGSKFQAGVWGVVCARISKETGRPVKFMLDRDIELKVAGNRPSGYVKVRLGADSSGLVKVWDSQLWGTAGITPGGNINAQVVPYVFAPKNLRNRQTVVLTNAAPQQAWRAPGHPQACALTQTAYDDLAAKLGMDSYELFLTNLPTVSNGKADVYRAEMEVAARLMDWKAKWHPHGKGEARGSIVSGLGMALHTWGGGAGNSTCRLKVHPDGGVEVFSGTQDLGTGTRTTIGMVVAETFGLSLEAVKVNIGNSKYPASGGSGGSTTIGGVSAANRVASLKALDHLFGLAAPKLGAAPEHLEARDGRIRVAADPSKGMSWKDACSLLEMKPLEVDGDRRDGNDLVNSQVGGVQMAEVEVDKATGEVRMKKFVAVQDMGLVVNRQTATSQIHGAVIMGIAYALFEERIMDPASGLFLNADLSDYRLPRLGDVGEIVVELYEPDSEYERGVVGLGEPPVISPGAAISNAVANALGVRVPVLPMTPQRVLKALGNA
jgi:xanthine dehydrogenase YagR molybdenum-binding subunit